MSTFAVRLIGDRVAIVHDMPDQVVISELDWAQAAVLLTELQRTVATSLLSIIANARAD